MLHFKFVLCAIVQPLNSRTQFVDDLLTDHIIINHLYLLIVTSGFPGWRCFLRAKQCEDYYVI